MRNDICIPCGGKGFVSANQTDDDFCPDCNGTGIAATRRHWLAYVIVFFVIFWPAVIAYVVSR